MQTAMDPELNRSIFPDAGIVGEWIYERLTFPSMSESPLFRGAGEDPLFDQIHLIGG